MLIKEYRIPLPMTVDEYRIAQLYMIAKKSRDESSGTGSGVEILINEPYSNGPGGSGQFTHKIYHVGSHLPGWFKSLLPKSALIVEEESWNAYPYTKTKFKCPFVEKFSLEIETYYTPDGGHLENVFNLTDSEKRNRSVDLIDVVNDNQDVIFGEPEKEDPTIYISSKTDRGPLSSDWIQTYWDEVKSDPLQRQPTPSGKSIMCAYKLCKVEFRYWGMQSKIERFIHDVALRKTMLHAHLQAWIWQDEWFGLTMEDIRAIEAETAELLKKTMHAADPDAIPSEQTDDCHNVHNNPSNEHKLTNNANSSATLNSSDSSQDMRAKFKGIEYGDKDIPDILPKQQQKQPHSSAKIPPQPPPRHKMEIPKSCSNHTSPMEACEQGDSDEEFFDCREEINDTVSLAKWSSMELPPMNEDESSGGGVGDMLKVENTQHHVSFRRVNSLRSNNNDNNDYIPVNRTLSSGSTSTCPTTLLIFVMHGGSVLDPCVDLSVRKSDVTTFRGALESIMRTHYPSLVGHVTIKSIPCAAVCSEALAVLSSLSPYSFDVNTTNGDFGISNDRLPVGTIPLFATCSPEYENAVTKVIKSANDAYKEFMHSEEGQGFFGQTVIVGDSVGSILAYDALCRSVKRAYSDSSVAGDDMLLSSGKEDVRKVDSLSSTTYSDSNEDYQQSRSHLSTPQVQCSRKACDIYEERCSRLDFEVSDFFTFGSPLGILLAYRKIQQQTSNHSIHPYSIPRPAVQQMYNLFHPSDPIACRIEPLLSARFSRVPPVNVSRYQKYPMGDGTCLSLIEFIQSNPGIFGVDNSRPTTPGKSRRLSEDSIVSGVLDTQQLHTINILKPKWWGSRRIDYALYCPEGLANFPTSCLPHLFHSSYWESSDVISFILRILVRGEPLTTHESNPLEHHQFTPTQPREKWIKKRTSVKIRNGAANHRGNDVVVKEGIPQVLQARFSYGPLDMSALTGEKVDIHIMKDPPGGDWLYLATELTDKNGRLSYTLKEQMGYGIYPVRMLVRGDHTMLHMYLAVVPPYTECVVFSIDGSFAASVSVTGKDPKVKPGAVDIVRHWQELGYVIVYVTARPDMQLQKVVSWLSQHNFPHGLVSFADGFTTDPLRHKADYLRNLIEIHSVVIHRAYGSNKDISVYSGIGLKPEQIYVVGKPSKKQVGAGTWLLEGYADHLAELTSRGGSRTAQGNARMVIPKAIFGLPGQKSSGGLTRRRTLRPSAKRTISYPVNSETSNTSSNNSPTPSSHNYNTLPSYSANSERITTYNEVRSSLDLLK
ncbi:protein retinal degeneration B isoform X4 [Lepeophtheirus salmonis]|uniref:protein retinal degeneration B isoform X4 n=1 Tax=Lepeophtheirus salmonis TaxID=72036 RepID=UPI001AE46AF5|nr:protein retinal degeneration B-like isoform X3 [Lepeophtheirus salmonis]